MNMYVAVTETPLIFFEAAEEVYIEKCRWRWIDQEKKDNRCRYGVISAERTLMQVCKSRYLCMYVCMCVSM